MSSIFFQQKRIPVALRIPPLCIRGIQQTATQGETHVVTGSSNSSLSSLKSANNEAEEKSINHKLSTIIRAGIGSLQSSALAIHQNPRAQMPLFAPSVNERSTTTPRQDYESKRLLAIANDCIDSSVLHAEDHPLLFATGDPILLVSCRVNEKCTHAVLYWSLPYSVLSQLDSVKQQNILEKVMKERVETDTAIRKVQQRVQAAAGRLKVRWELAAAADVLELMHAMEGDSSEDEGAGGSDRSDDENDVHSDIESDSD